MTTHHTSGAADLPAIQRYKIGYQSDDWGTRSSTPSGIPDASGSWVRYADHVAAIAAGQAISAEPAGAGYAAWPEPEVHDEGGWHITYYTATMMRDFADRTHALRATHGQAPAQPDLGTLNGLAKQYADSYASPHHFTLGVNGLRQIIQRALPQAAPAAQADSVQEDAMRYRWLRDEAHPDGVVNDDIHVHVDSLHYPNRWALIGPELDAAVDAARAAQKGGEKP